MQIASTVSIPSLFLSVTTSVSRGPGSTRVRPIGATSPASDATPTASNSICWSRQRDGPSSSFSRRAPAVTSVASASSICLPIQPSMPIGPTTTTTWRTCCKRPARSHCSPCARKVQSVLSRPGPASCNITSVRGQKPPAVCLNQCCKPIRAVTAAGFALKVVFFIIALSVSFLWVATWVIYYKIHTAYCILRVVAGGLTRTPQGTIMQNETRHEGKGISRWHRSATSAMQPSW